MAEETYRYYVVAVEVEYGHTMLRYGVAERSGPVETLDDIESLKSVFTTGHWPNDGYTIINWKRIS